MQLRQLRLKNIRSYESAEVTFGPGTTLVVGDVGSGKTSLLYAIEMALFGFAEVDPTYLVRHEAPNAEVMLTLEEPPHTYSLSRRFRRRGRKGRDLFELVDSTFSANGAKVQYPATELRQRVIDLLGFPDNPNPRAHSDFWRWAVYIPQERMREVLQQDPDERLETVRKALGVEQYRTAADNALEVVRELRQRAEGKEAEADRLRFFDQEFSRAEREREEQRRRIGKLRSDETEARRRLEEIGAKVQQGEESRTRREGLRREIERLQPEFGASQESIERIAEQRSIRQRDVQRLAEEATALTLLAKEIGQLDQAMADLNRERDRLRPEVKRLQENRSALAEVGAEAQTREAATKALQEGLSRSEQEIEEITRVQGELESEGPRRAPPTPTPRIVSEIDKDLLTIQQDLDRALQELGQLEHAQVELEEILRTGVCPRCHQAVTPTDFSTHREEISRATEESRSKLVRLQTSREAAEMERRSRERYERALTRWNEVQRHRNSLKDALHRADQGRVTAQRALDQNTRRIQELRIRMGELQSELWEGERAEARSFQIETERETVDSRRNEATRALGHAQNSADQIELLRREDRAAEREEGLRRRRMLELNELLEELERRSRSVSEEERALEQWVIDRDQSREALQSALQELARSETLTLEAERRATEAATGIAERQRLIRQADHLRRLGQWLSEPFRGTVLGLERRLLAHAQVEFDRLLGRYFSSLVEDPAIIARSDTSFSPSAEIDGAWTPPEALSGGERTALALAFRLALGHVVRSMGQLGLVTLILDEPTDGFSPEQVTRLGELLDDLKLPQVLLVSHEAQLSAIADRVIHVTKQGGISRLQPSIAPSPTPLPGSEFLSAAPRRRRAPRIQTLDGAAGLRKSSPASSGIVPDPTGPSRRSPGSPRDGPVASDR
jgi:exonuclease SbcC